MSLRTFPWYAVALVAIILGAAALGVHVSTLLVLACPLMMLAAAGMTPSSIGTRCLSREGHNR
jgi:hypothetical protein